MKENMDPKHVAIIMDGNRRWAKERGKEASSGHQAGAKNLEDLCLHILGQDIKTLSIFAFSTENFKREASEIKYIMDLVLRFLKKNIKTIQKHNIKILISGRKDGLRGDVLKAISKAEEDTFSNTGGVLNICLNYGAQQELLDATKKLAQLYKAGEIDLESIDEEEFYKYLYQDLEPVDFLIRTSGELRLSNFLLYQIAYSELYFTDKYFPDFNAEEFDKALDEYHRRKRRFGG